MTRKRNLIIAAGIGLAVTAFGASSALADPSGAPQYRTIPGVGSDTTQGVMNALANVIVDGGGTKLLGSYDATGSAKISTAAAAACQNLDRPNGSGAGRTALVNSLAAANGCVGFSRSSSLDQTATPNNLTYVPYAVDAVSFAVVGNGNVPAQLTLAQVKAIYHCDPSIVGTGPNYAIHALLPQANSGTRKFWESVVGIAEADVANGVYGCISDKHNGVPIEEHDGRVLDANSIVPFSTAQYIAQAGGTLADLRGSAQLGVIDGITPVTLNTAVGQTREVYNVIPTSKVADPTYANVFVGPGSQVCSNKTIIQQYGFALDNACGDTSKHTQ